MIAQIAAVVAPLFICSAIGYGWGRLERPFDSQMVTALALQIGLPCLVFTTLVTLEVPAGALAASAFAFFVVMLASLAVGALLLLPFGLPRTVFLPGLAFGNTGNMGLPVCLFAFGAEGLGYAIGVLVVSSITSYILGMAIYAGRASLDVVVKNPLVYAVIAAGAFRLVEVAPPGWLLNTTGLLGGLGIPLMILSLGVAISKLRMASAPRSLGLSVARLAIGVGVGWAVAMAFGLDGVAKGVVILQSAMPVAVHNYLFAQRFDRRPDEVAGMIMGSTALSLALLPLLLWLLL